MNVHNGLELRKLRAKLRTLYETKQKVIDAIDHGGGINRQRVFVAGLHRRMGKAAFIFKFSRVEEHEPPSARNYADPDHMVPEKYWQDTPSMAMTKQRHLGKGGRLFKIAQIATGMGHSSLPHAIYSWDGIFN